MPTSSDAEYSNVQYLKPKRKSRKPRRRVKNKVYNPRATNVSRGYDWSHFLWNNLHLYGVGVLEEDL